MSTENIQNSAEQNALQFAHDVLAVNAALGTTAGRRALGSTSAKYLKEWVDEHKDHLKEFYTKILPKAQDTLARFNKNETNEDVIRIERRAIAELKAELGKALREASVTV